MSAPVTDVNIDVLEEPDGRYRLTARIAGVTYLTDRFGVRGRGLRIDYTELLDHAAAVVLAARPAPEDPEIEYDTRTPAERIHQASRPPGPGLDRPAWMRVDAVVTVAADGTTGASPGWIKGFLDTADPTVPSVVVYRQPDGPGIFHPDLLTPVPDPPSQTLTWIDDEKRQLREESWGRLRQRASGLRVYRLDREADLLAKSLVPRADLTEPRIVDIDLETGPPDDRSDYRDVSEQHRLTLTTPDGPLHDSSFHRANQIHAHATALLLTAHPDPGTPLPGWRLRTLEDRLLGERGPDDAFRPLPAGLIVRTPMGFGRVDHLMTPDLVAVVQVGKDGPDGPVMALFDPDELRPYEPTPPEQARMDAQDRQIRQDVRARAEREAGPAGFTARGSTPDPG